MIAVAIPSRGLIHSRTMQDILSNIRNFDEIGFYFSHGHPIPDSHNIMVEEALKDKPDFIWLCEDDMAYPHDILDRMIKADVDLCLADYPAGVGKLPTIKYAKDGELQYGGLGCALIKPWVFKKLKYPYFRTEVSYQEDTMETIKAQGNHGLHDVDFWVRALALKTSYVVIGRVGHYYLKSPQLPKYGNDTALSYKVEKCE